MTISEIQTYLSIPEKMVKQYIADGFLSGRELPDGSLELEELQLDDLKLIQLFMKAGFSKASILQYLRLSKKDGMEDACIRILRRHRGKLLEDIHEKQRLLDNLDFVIWEKQKTDPD